MSGDRDRVGRRRRTEPTSTGKRITLQPRDLAWLEILHLHGPLSSSFLLAFARDQGKSEKRAKERLTDLFNEDNTPHGGPYLTRPPQQFHTLDSRYNQLVYDLTRAGKQALQDAGRWQDRSQAARGPWLHSHMAASITASIHLFASEHPRLYFIPQSGILARADTELAYPVPFVDPKTKATLTKVLKPDGLFGLQYETPAGPRFRFFVVEADRSTEPYTSRNFNRKSVLRSLLQYRMYVGQGLYKKHLKLTAPLLVLHVCSDAARMERMIALLGELGGKQHFQLFQAWPDFMPPFRPPNPNPDLLLGLWSRSDRNSLNIGEA